VRHVYRCNQVQLLEDEEGRVSFRNLSIHRANNEEEALNLVGSVKMSDIPGVIHTGVDTEAQLPRGRLPCGFQVVTQV
jgi:hypothetical protein